MTKWIQIKPFWRGRDGKLHGCAITASPDGREMFFLCRDFCVHINPLRERAMLDSDRCPECQREKSCYECATRGGWAPSQDNERPEPDLAAIS